MAASLGKLVRPRERGAARNEDVARGILDAITNNVVRCISQTGLILTLPRPSWSSTATTLPTPDCRHFAPDCTLLRYQGSLAMLHARTHKVAHVVFAGNFLRRNPISSTRKPGRRATHVEIVPPPSCPPLLTRTVARLTYAFEFWSKGAMKAVFLKHEGYLGALGALVYSSLHQTHPTFVHGSSASSEASTAGAL